MGGFAIKCSLPQQSDNYYFTSVARTGYLALEMTNCSRRVIENFQYPPLSGGARVVLVVGWW